jgi:hypothetical protein
MTRTALRGNRGVIESGISERKSVARLAQSQIARSLIRHVSLRPICKV